MTEAKGNEKAKEKKERKGGLPVAGEFKDRGSFLKAMADHWVAKHAHFLKHGDVRKQQTAKRAEKLKKQILELKANPEYAELFKDVKIG